MQEKSCFREGLIQDSEKSLFSFTLSLGLHVFLLLFLSLKFNEKDRLFPKKEDSLEIVLQRPRQKNLFVKAPENQKTVDKKPEKEVPLKSNRTLRTKIETWKRHNKSLSLQSSIGSHNSSGSNQGGRQKNSGFKDEKKKAQQRGRTTHLSQKEESQNFGKESELQKTSQTTDEDFSFKQKPAEKKQIALRNGNKNRWKTKKDKKKLSSQTNRKSYQSQTEQKKPLYVPGFSGGNNRPSLPSFVQQKLPPGVRLGNITALNTDEHRYYSFIQRLLSKFLPLWAERVSVSVYQWARENNSPVISKTWLTQVQVIMDEKGEILEVQPFRLSGRWSIDSATVKSFKKIETVPNPPKEMIDENGYIHLQFQTEVLWIPQPHRPFQSSQ